MKPNQLNSRSFQIFLLILTIVGITSCIPQKELNYFSKLDVPEIAYKLSEKPVARIKPFDELYIKVASLDDVAFNFFSTQGDNSRTGFSNELSVSLISYTVNDSGYIYFPILGNIYVENLTLDQARENLEKMLSEYFNQPTVVMKYAYKKISILGQVNIPGNHTYTKENLNILEALSIAGDINMHGNRKQVYLIRSEKDSINKIRLNLQADDIFFNPYFYLQPDDIVYVEARKSVKWDAVSVPISLVFSTITTALLILNYF